MNQQLRKQLQHPKARIRHEAIVKLARLKDEDALPLLHEISKHDPEPSLRQLAERAINHILNDFSSTMSRATTTEAPPSTIPPFSNPEAEKHIYRAYELYEQGNGANALQYLIKALDMTPTLVDDFDVQLLAENLTGVEGAVAAKMLADRDKRKHFFDNDTPPPSSSFPITPSAIIIFMLFLAVFSQFYLIDGIEVINRALDGFSMLQLKQSARQVDDTSYYVITPDTTSATQPYPLLVAIPSGNEDADAMLDYFADFAELYDMIVLVPDFIDYPNFTVDPLTDTLHKMVTDVSSDYPIEREGAILFGFGDGAIVATHYANSYPDTTAHVMTSGATFLHPPPEDINYTIIYGADDALIRSISDSNTPFADLSQWNQPLNYLTIENIGHEINIQQIEIVKQVILDVYQ